jgi:hypothetical protein
MAEARICITISTRRVVGSVSGSHHLRHGPRRLRKKWLRRLGPAMQRAIVAEVMRQARACRERVR